jgi:prepilin-type N-terminal cleavage/methylation domain-containing protein/prepilin-type processing-associated H-X9-DG protein
MMRGQGEQSRRRVRAGSLRLTEDMRAFSLIELLVVVGIIAILIAIMLPSLQRSVRQAASTVCQHNLRTINHGLEMYRMDNNGWIPVADEDATPAMVSETWFTALHPRYIQDSAVMSCPDDPYAGARRQVSASPDAQSSALLSYGLSDFIQSGAEGYLANLDRFRPTRAHETLLVADVGPDHVLGGGVVQEPGLATHRSTGRLPWDDSYDPGEVCQLPSWLTVRHLGGINALMVDGAVRHLPTDEIMHATIEDFYPDCAAGDCPLCRELEVPHYSFARANTYWWTGLLPQP